MSNKEMEIAKIEAMMREMVAKGQATAQVRADGKTVYSLMMTEAEQEKLLDTSVGRIARRAGLTMHRSHRGLSLDNQGGYQLVNPVDNSIVAGEKFDLSAEDVLAWCSEGK